MIVIILRADKLKCRCLSHHQAFTDGQFSAQGMKKLPTALCHFTHHGVSSVFIGFKTCHRIGDKQDFHQNFLVNRRYNHTLYSACLKGGKI